MSDRQYKRMFIGIPLPMDYSSAILAYQKTVPDRSEIRFTKEKNLHITVAFFGKVEVEMIPNLVSLIQLCLANVSPFSLEVEKWKLAPKPGEARMIWLSFRRSELYTNLAHTLINTFDKIQKTQQFRKKPIPHITVARFRQELGSKIRISPEVALPPLKVSRLILWESMLLPDGPVYKEVHGFYL